MQCRVCQIDIIAGLNCSLTDIKYRIYLCFQCKSDKNREYKIENNYNIIKNLNNKEKFFKILGEYCKCCGQNIWQFLTLDHINNDGANDRKLGKVISRTSLYRFAETEDLSRFQNLCMNCNYTKGHHGFCPHITIPQNLYKLDCNICNVKLEDNNWFNINNIYNHYICNNCMIDKSISKKIIIKDYKRKLTKKKEILNLKYNIVQGYGGSCECCGEKELLFLTIDHINGGGRTENKNLKKYGSDFYRWLKTNNYPKENYQLLCYNCNCCKGSFGQCYHNLCKEYNKDSISISEYKDIILQTKEINYVK